MSWWIAEIPHPNRMISPLMVSFKGSRMFKQDFVRVIPAKVATSLLFVWPWKLQRLFGL